jgi:hypothetical protein
MGEIKHLNQNFFVFMHVNIFSLNSHSCHPKFMHMQQKFDFLRSVQYCINSYTV